MVDSRGRVIIWRHVVMVADDDSTASAGSGNVGRQSGAVCAKAVTARGNIGLQPVALTVALTLAIVSCDGIQTVPVAAVLTGAIVGRLSKQPDAGGAKTVTARGSLRGKQPEARAMA